MRRHGFFRRRQNLLALLLVGLYLGVAVAAPVLAPPDDAANPSAFRRVPGNFSSLPTPPGETLLGTAPGGLDIYYTLVWGARSALSFGLTAALGAALIGVMVGAVGGFAGGLANTALMGLTDAFLTFPTVAGVWFFRQVIFSTFPVEGSIDALSPFQTLLLHTDTMLLALILFSWMSYARLINVNIVQLKQAEYVTAARSLGVNRRRLLLRHLLPNAAAPVVVLAARDVGALVLLESAFTFIGLGGSTAWGRLIVSGRDYVIGLAGNPFAYWWTFVPVSLALIGFSVAWNLLGDGINDLLNPRSGQRSL